MDITDIGITDIDIPDMCIRDIGLTGMAITILGITDSITDTGITDIASYLSLHGQWHQNPSCHLQPTWINPHYFCNREGMICWYILVGFW
jgi:hypothetical protein